MKWLFAMKPSSRGWLILAIGFMMLYLHWVEVLHTKAPKFAMAFTTPWVIVIGLLFLLYPQIQERQPNLSWLANNKLHWKANVVFITVCIVVGLLHYQFQTAIFR